MVPTGEDAQVEDTESSHASVAGHATAERAAVDLPAPVARPWARGLTTDGETRFDAWSRSKTAHDERRLYHEMERQALSRNRPGEPVFTWQHVEDAIEALELAEQKKIENQVRQKLRPAIIKEVRLAERRRLLAQRRAAVEQERLVNRTRRSRRRWRWLASATLTAGSASTIAVVATPVPTWQKILLVAAALVGAWLAGPGRPDEPSQSGDPMTDSDDDLLNGDVSDVDVAITWDHVEPKSEPDDMVG